jgi:hypothetical protein
MNLSADGGGLFLFILTALSNFVRELMRISFYQSYHCLSCEKKKPPLQPGEIILGVLCTVCNRLFNNLLWCIVGAPFRILIQ